MTIPHFWLNCLLRSLPCKQRPSPRALEDTLQSSLLQSASQEAPGRVLSHSWNTLLPIFCKAFLTRIFFFLFESKTERKKLCVLCMCWQTAVAVLRCFLYALTFPIAFETQGQNVHPFFSSAFWSITSYLKIMRWRSENGKGHENNKIMSKIWCKCMGFSFFHSTFHFYLMAITKLSFYNDGFTKYMYLNTNHYKHVSWK